MPCTAVLMDLTIATHNEKQPFLFSLCYPQATLYGADCMAVILVLCSLYEDCSQCAPMVHHKADEAHIS